MHAMQYGQPHSFSPHQPSQLDRSLLASLGGLSLAAGPAVPAPALQSAGGGAYFNSPGNSPPQSHAPHANFDAVMQQALFMQMQQQQQQP